MNVLPSLYAIKTTKKNTLVQILFTAQWTYNKMVWFRFGILLFNGTFSTNSLHHATEVQWVTSLFG